MPSMLVMGDSILWGQGLREPDKCTTLLKDAWQAATGWPVDHYRFAHSGADIWDDNRSGRLAKLDPVPPPFPPLPVFTPNVVLQSRPSQPMPVLRDAVGEIPNDQAFLLRQIFDASSTLQGTPIDLIVVDMGINDMTICDLVLPGKSKDAVVKRARSIAPYVKAAMSQIGNTFPGAKVLVTGYYAMVSEQSNLRDVLQFANDLLKLVSFVDVPWRIRLSTFLAFGRLTSEAFRAFGEDLASRDAAWRDEMHDVLRAEVLAFDAGRRIARFVDPAFQPDNALFAQNSLLWHYLQGAPPDPMAPERVKWCIDNGIGGFDRLIIEAASFGHPSPEGARRYGQALIEAAQEIGVFPGAPREPGGPPGRAA